MWYVTCAPVYSVNKTRGDLQYTFNTNAQTYLYCECVSIDVLGQFVYKHSKKNKINENVILICMCKHIISLYASERPVEQLPNGSVWVALYFVCLRRVIHFKRF